MKDFNLVISLFLIYCLISLSRSSSDSSGGVSNGLGIALCDVWALFNSKCGTPDVPVESFPPECTSFFYGPLDLTAGTVVMNTVAEMPKGYLNSLLSLNKPVTVWITRDSWVDFLKCVEQDGAETEMANLKTYLEKHKGITGIAIYKAELQSNDVPDPEYTQKLIAYICILRKNFPDMKIGLYLDCGTIINTLNKEQLKSLDLACLDQHVDFFRMLSATLSKVNECSSPEYKYGEDVMNSFNKKVLDYISGFNISKEKIVWDIWGVINIKDNLNICDLMYPHMCTYPNDTYCAITQQRFYEKGKYFREIAGGFGLIYIDMDDVNCCCLCRKFPVFYAIWDGFNGNPPPEECCLFDRPEN